MSCNQESHHVCRASEMWVGMRTICGETSMVVGITVAGETHLFLATREVFGPFAEQIAALPDAPVPGPNGSQPSLPVAGRGGRETSGGSCSVKGGRARAARGPR